jgi:prevent-host-death family protein
MGIYISKETAMENVISKSKFKPKALQYFRQVQESGRELIITDHSKPVLKIVPYREETPSLESLRNTVLRYDDPTGPVGEDEWDALK